MGSLALFFLIPIIVGTIAGFLIFAQNRSQPSEPGAASDGSPAHLHHGINTASVAGEGLSGIPGLLITVAFVFFFFGIFLPRDNQWFLVLFIVVEVGAAVLYILLTRRSRKDAARIRRAMHEIGDKQD